MHLPDSSHYTIIATFAFISQSHFNKNENPEQNQSIVWIYVSTLFLLHKM